MCNTRLSYLFLGLLSFLFGCESEKSKQARLAEKETRKQSLESKIAEKRRQAEELESQIKIQEKMIEDRESKWLESVNSRHPKWSRERKEQQIGILVRKWKNSNRTNDEDTVREMHIFAREWYRLGGISVDLIEEDYWDIARAKSANWGTEDLIIQLRKRLGDINSSLRFLQSQLQF